jgi:hypothetical protein
MLTPTEVMSRTTRTTPIPDVAALAPRIAAVRQAAAAAGRDPGSLQIVVAGAWPMLDLRSGRPAARYLEEVATLEALGVDWVISLVCGDDPTVSLETVQRFGEDVIAAAR